MYVQSVLRCETRSFTIIAIGISDLNETYMILVTSICSMVTDDAICNLAAI